MRPTTSAPIDPYRIHTYRPRPDNIERITTYEPDFLHTLPFRRLPKLLCKVVVNLRLRLIALHLLDGHDLGKDGGMRTEIWTGMNRVGDHAVGAVGKHHGCDA